MASSLTAGLTFEPDVVVLTAANHWTDARMADHQLARALSAHIRVLYVDPPVPRFRRGGSQPQENGSVWVIRPFRLPLLSFRPTSWISQILVAGQVRATLRRLRPRAAVLLEANMFTPLAGRLGSVPTVYWAQDDWQGMAPLIGVSAELLARSELRVLHRSTKVIAANPVVAAQIAALGGDVEIIPFGANTDHFRQAVDGRTPRSDAIGQSPAVLMGTINSRIDFELLAAVAEAGVPTLLIGPIADAEIAPKVDSLLAHPNVRWIGEVDFAELPSYLRECSVGMVPYTHSRFNEGSFPLKTLEYLAAGLPVVATDLPAIQWLESPDVSIADTPQSFVHDVRVAFEMSPREDDLRRRQDFASGHDWTARAIAFFDVLKNALAPSR